MIRILRVLGVLAALTFSASAWAQMAFCPADSFGKADKLITTLPYTISQKDVCRTKVFNSSGSGAVDIPAPGTAGGFLPNFPVTLYNMGSGTLTLTPLAPAVSGSTPTINGQTTITLTQGQGAELAVGADGNWYANTTSGSVGGVLPVPNGGTGASTLTSHGVLLGNGTSAVTATAAGTAGQLLIGSSGAPAFATPASALTTPSNPSAVTPGTSTAQMLGMGGGTGAATVTPAATGRVYYDFTFTALVASTTNGATFQCSHGTGTAPANAASVTGTQDSAAVAYLAGATTEKAVIHCSGTLTGLALGTAVWFDVAVLNTTGSQAVTVTVPTFNAFEF